MVFSSNLNDRNCTYFIKDNIFDNVTKYTTDYKKVVIITDDNVHFIYKDLLNKYLPNALLFSFKPREKNKSLKIALSLIDFLVDNNISNQDLLIAFGGGVVLDLVGFVSSIYKRGITYFSIPTTLLAQVDACIGFKTAIDYKGLKNVIGSFYLPSKVFIDYTFIKTLPNRQIRNGLFEVIKMGLVYDKSLFDLLLTNNIKKELPNIINKAIVDKLEIVKQDPYDNNIRKILNYGHTIGHAIESNNRFNNILHGEAVAYGMLYETTNQEIKNKLLEIYKKIHFTLKLNVDINKLVSYIYNDKKVSDDTIIVPVVETIGRCDLINMKISEFIKMIGAR